MPRVVEPSQLWLEGIQPAIEVDMKAIDDFCEEMAECDHAANTQVNYNSHFKLFQTWCEQMGRPALPTNLDTLKRFVGYELQVKKLKVSTIYAHLFGIRAAHLRAKVKMPATDYVRRILKNTRKVRKEPRRGQGKESFTLEQLRKISAKLARKGDHRSLRDRAILITGFVSGQRRSNLAALTMEDVRIVKQGVRMRIRESKTDQTGEGRILGLPWGKQNRPNTCPVRTLQDWLAVRGRGSGGPLFCHISRGGEIDTSRPIHAAAIGDIVKRGAQMIGLDPKPFAGHSLRKTMASEAKNAGAQDSAILERGGWKMLQTVADHYFQTLDPFAAPDPLARVL